MFVHVALGAVLGLIAFKAIRHHRRACGYAYGGGGCGSRGWHGHHHHHHHEGGGEGPWEGGGGPSRFRGGRGRWMWAALAQLDLTPAQEKLVRAEVDTIKNRVRTLKDEKDRSRADLASSVRGDSFDEQALAGMFIRHDDALHGLREDLAGALGRIHTALDPAQRERLAELIERGPRGRGRGPWGGPYRM